MASIEELAGSRPITAMTPEAEQMTHRPEQPNPDRAILDMIGSIIGVPNEMAKQAFQSSESMRKGGNYDPAPVMQAATLATPAGAAVMGAPARAIGGMARDIFSAAPKTTAAGIAGAGAMMPGTTGAETRQARSEREAKQRAEQTKLEGEQKLKEISARAEAASAEAKQQAQLAKEAEERHAQAAQEEEQHRLDMSFREKHPYLSQMFTGAGWAASVALPYVSRVLNTRSSNTFVKEVQGIANDANAAIAAGDIKKGATLVNQLANKEKQAKSMDKDGKLSKMLLGTSMMAPIELGAAPEEMDIMFGTPKAKERAKEELMPTSNPLRLPIAMAQGVSLGSIGAKAPTQRRLPVPEGSAAAARKSLTEVKKTMAPSAEKSKPSKRPLKVIEGDK